MSKGGLKHTILYFLKLLAFWMLVFAIQRTVFLIFNIGALSNIPAGTIAASYWYALGMDISTACYIMVIPVLLFSAALFIKKGKVLNIVLNTYIIVALLIILAIGFFDLGIYINWGSKLNAKALALTVFGNETAGIIFSRNNLLPFGLFLILAAVFTWLYLRFIRNRKTVIMSLPAALLTLLISLGLMFTGIRGGLQKYPISRSWVYFSKYPVLNNAALNGTWNVVEILSKPHTTVNPYNYLNEAVAKAIVDSLHYTVKDTTEYLFTVQRPNIVLIMMESMSAENFDVLGGDRGIAPCFDTLCKQGLLFTDIYASGFRTDQGLVAMISGFPAQPASAVIKSFGKFDKMPNLVRTLSENGYYTSFYCGGNQKFANTDTYLIAAGIDKISGETEIPHARSTQWGVYDEDLYKYIASDEGKSRQPFFSIVATQTNHEEFDADVETVFSGGTMADRFRNTSHYADKALYDFLLSVRNQPWFHNTLFVITADHAHRFPKERAYNEPLRHHIPFLLYGDVLRPEYRGKQFNATFSQVDFPATLLAQLAVDKTKRREYRWSKNMMNRYSDRFAFYAFDNGFGFITPQAVVVYDHNMGQVVDSRDRVSDGVRRDILRDGKAYLQRMFREFLDL